MSRVTHEMVTLQLGHYSNFVGSHWWNMQEASFVYDPKLATGPKEVNHDVMFREGQNLLGQVTFTPRLVLFDLKGSLNTLKQDGHLYDLPEVADDIQWSSDVTMHKGPALPKNEFLKDLEREDPSSQDDKVNAECDMEDGDLDVTEAHPEEPRTYGTKLYDLDESVKVWSDYLRIHLHPRTVHIVEQYTHDSDSAPFDVFTQGCAVYKDRKTREDIEDKVHYFLEECDHLQGVHIMTDTFNGFGGLTGSLLQDLEDDLSRKCLLVTGVSPPDYGETTPMQDSYRLMTMALTFDKIANHSSAFIPMSLASSYGRKPGPSIVLPHLNYKSELPYHTSAILAAGLDTMTLPHRLERPPSLMSHLTQALTPGSRKVLGMYSSLPFPMETNTTLTDTLLQLGDLLPWQPLTPGCRSDVSCTAQSLVVRGLPTGKLKGVVDPERSRMLDRCDSLQDLMSLYMEEMCGCSHNAICGVRGPCMVAAPFPHVFLRNISKNGCLSGDERTTETGVEEVPMMTSLQSTLATRQTIKSLLDDVTKIDIKKHHQILDEGLEADDYTESLHNLRILMDNYDDQTNDML